MQRQVLSGETEPQRHREEYVFRGSIITFTLFSYSFWAAVGHLSPYSCFAGGEMQPASVKAGNHPTTGSGVVLFSQLWQTVCTLTWKKLRIFVTPVLQAGLYPSLAVVSDHFSQEQYADLCFWQEALSKSLVCLSRSQSLPRQTYPGCISTTVS